MVHDPHADHIRHRRGDMQLQDKAFESIGWIGSIAVHGRHPKRITLQLVFRDPSDTDWGDSLGPLPYTVTEFHCLNLFATKNAGESLCDSPADLQ